MFRLQGQEYHVDHGLTCAGFAPGRVSDSRPFRESPSLVVQVPEHAGEVRGVDVLQRVVRIVLRPVHVEFDDARRPETTGREGDVPATDMTDARIAGIAATKSSRCFRSSSIGAATKQRHQNHAAVVSSGFGLTSVPQVLTMSCATRMSDVRNFVYRGKECRKHDEARCKSAVLVIVPFANVIVRGQQASQPTSKPSRQAGSQAAS